MKYHWLNSKIPGKGNDKDGKGVTDDELLPVEEIADEIDSGMSLLDAIAKAKRLKLGPEAEVEIANYYYSKYRNSGLLPF